MIGTAHRVYARYLRAAETVRVRHRASGEVMEIARGTLRDDPDAYETLHSNFVAPSPLELAVARAYAPRTAWAYPDIEGEREEFQRAADELGVSVEDILTAIPHAQAVPLSETMWQRMMNTDSWATDTVEKAVEYARRYDKDIRDILLGFGGDMDCPIVLLLPGNVPMLVGGNTRLMTFRGLGIRPMVLMVDVRHLPAEITQRAGRGSG